MSAKKQLIRRYLLAAMIGVVVGLVGLIAGYEDYLEHSRTSIAEVDGCASTWGEDQQFKPGSRNTVRVLLQEGIFLTFLLERHSAYNIRLGSTLLVPFAVYTFNVVAASRRKRTRGAT
jgi:hypothetical protein